MKKIFLILFFLVFHLSFDIPKRIEKRIDKEILIVFDIESYYKEVIVVDEIINKKLKIDFNEDNFYKISSGEDLVGYFYYGKALSKVDEFDFVVIFDYNLIIKKIKILAYREDYGGEISSKRWLSQFNDLTIEDTIAYKKEIKAISGATISAISMTKAVNNLLISLTILQNYMQL